MLIKVKVFPESTENKVEKISSDKYEVFVRAKAENNHANTLAIHLISKHFGRGVKLVSGSTKQNKIFEIL